MEAYYTVYSAYMHARRPASSSSGARTSTCLPSQIEGSHYAVLTAPWWGAPRETARRSVRAPGLSRGRDVAWRRALALTVALVLEVALIFHAKRARLQRLQPSDALSCASSCETGPQKMILSEYNYQIMSAYSVWCPRTKVVTECFLFFPLRTL